MVELLAPRGRDKGLEIGWYAAPDLPKTVIGDEMRVRQILMNLMSNAIKFTDLGGVALTVGLVPGEPQGGKAVLRFAVRDTGPGVPPTAIERIFSEFEQGEQGPARRHGGTGLGLAISKRLVEEMAGRIDVTSVPGAGATFTVDLPFATPAHVMRVDEAWPRPQAGERVLLVLDGAIEAALVGDLLVAMGASVARVKAKDAPRVAADAAENGMPFSALLTDKANVEAGAGQLLPLLSPASSKRPTARAVVIIDPSERSNLPRFRAHGFNGYLVRPLRPLSTLTQLFDGAGAAHTKPAAETGLLRLHPLPLGADAAAGLAVLLAEDNDINALLATTVLEKSGARVVRARDGAEAVSKAADDHADGGGPWLRRNSDGYPHARHGRGGGGAADPGPLPGGGASRYGPATDRGAHRQRFRRGQGGISRRRARRLSGQTLREAGFGRAARPLAGRGGAWRADRLRRGLAPRRKRPFPSLSPGCHIDFELVC
ncbi:hypothetical protein AUC69_00150 [Methyloceanibacter superfactus]|uniref:histidine kinase n=1 Tax=Methyloceanibacter superfactus TaxID=1774969 RepID=A0A1E3W821_9HYPH|nr:hypothetical protein AUC69_00150 [Methyloceanibacter superfactus]